MTTTRDCPVPPGRQPCRIAFLKDRFDLLAFPRTCGGPAAQKLLGSRAGVRQRGQGLEPLAAVAPKFDLVLRTGHRTVIGHGRGQDINTLIQVKDLDLPILGFCFRASNPIRAYFTAKGSCLRCRLTLIRRQVASISRKNRRVDRAPSWI